MTRRPFIAIAGRRRWVERVRQLVRDALPPCARRLVVSVLRPFRARATERAENAVLRQLFGDQAERDRYLSMRREARERWDAGAHEATGDPVPLPLSTRGGTVLVRPGTSDMLAYHDVVVREVYGTELLPSDATILDIGANVGLASAWLLERYPSARALALEPDPLNFELCRRNLQQFGDRARLLRAAVWDTDGLLRLSAGARGTWASRVEAGDGDIEAMTVATAIDRAGARVVHLLKIDVEGAERRILAADVGWLARVRCLMIELESDESRQLFLRVMSEHPEFRLTMKSDVTIASRSPAPPSR